MPPIELTSTDFKLLERVFTAEIENRLPAQFKSKHIPRLQEKGWIQPMQMTLGGQFPVIVKGWTLTEQGRMIYCQACTMVED